MVFSPIVKKNYEWLTTVNDADYKVFRSLDGMPRKAAWKPIVVRCDRIDKRSKQLTSDFPWLPG
jgi:hypothetical protein